MQLDNSLFETFQQLRNQQQNRQSSLLAQYDSKIKQQQQRTGQAPSTPLPTPPSGNEPSKPATTLTFANLNSKQLQQWVERGVSSGKLTEEQSSAFKALIYSATGGNDKNLEKPVNFSEKAQEALQSAVKRKDSNAMLFWANTVSAMKKFEGEALPK